MVNTKLALNICQDCWAKAGAWISEDGQPIVAEYYPEDYCPHVAVWPARVHR